MKTLHIILIILGLLLYIIPFIYNYKWIREIHIGTDPQYRSLWDILAVILPIGNLFIFIIIVCVEEKLKPYLHKFYEWFFQIK